MCLWYFYFAINDLLFIIIYGLCDVIGICLFVRIRKPDAFIFHTKFEDFTAREFIIHRHIAYLLNRITHTFNHGRQCHIMIANLSFFILVTVYTDYPNLTLWIIVFDI